MLDGRFDDCEDEYGQPDRRCDHESTVDQSDSSDHHHVFVRKEQVDERGGADHPKCGANTCMVVVSSGR